MTEEVLTYHDINKAHFIEARDRVRIATENYDLAQERKKEALSNDKGSELENQSQVQANLNEEREKIVSVMLGIKDSLKKPDNTPVPRLLKYELRQHDGLKLTFAYTHRRHEGEVTIDTTVASIFQKTCRAEVAEMKKSKRRAYVERGIDFALSFHSDSIVRFLTMDEFCKAKAGFIGKACLSHINGIVGTDPITKISKGANCVKVKVGETEHDIGEPVAVAADHGSIWAFEPTAGAFTWIWFDKPK